jgi:hypothetical protein
MLCVVVGESFAGVFRCYYTWRLKLDTLPLYIGLKLDFEITVTVRYGGVFWDLSPYSLTDF